jgi:ABC-type bacteriocin/lantibiotic exporter with double-glycine peptidase domain
VNDTVRNNIVGFSAFEAERYAAVTWACALGEDLRHWPGGDAMIVGGGAMTLSGGQKQRVVSHHILSLFPVLLTKRETLARAVYSQPELLLLDDVLSGLDLRTIEQITNRLLGPDGYLRRQQTTVLLATHAGMFPVRIFYTTDLTFLFQRSSSLLRTRLSTSKVAMRIRIH